MAGPVTVPGRYAGSGGFAATSDLATNAALLPSQVQQANGLLANQNWRGRLLSQPLPPPVIFFRAASTAANTTGFTNGTTASHTLSASIVTGDLVVVAVAVSSPGTQTTPQAVTLSGGGVTWQSAGAFPFGGSSGFGTTVTLAIFTAIAGVSTAGASLTTTNNVTGGTQVVSASYLGAAGVEVYRAGAAVASGGVTTLAEPSGAAPTALDMLVSVLAVWTSSTATITPSSPADTPNLRASTGATFFEYLGLSDSGSNSVSAGLVGGGSWAWTGAGDGCGILLALTAGTPPTVQRVNEGRNLTGSGTSGSAVVVTVPNGTGIKAGDLLVANCVSNGTHVTNGMTVSDSVNATNWTTLREDDESSASSFFQDSKYFATPADIPDGSTISFTPYASATSTGVAIDVFRGLSGVIDQAATGATPASGTSIPCPALGAAATAGSLVLSLAAGGGANTLTPAAPFTVGSANASQRSAGIGFVLAADGVSTYASTWTQSTTGSNAGETVSFAVSGGGAVVSGDVALAATAAVTAAGTATELAAAAVTGTAAITAAGTGTDLAAAAVAATATITASGTATELAAAAVAGTATITAAGTVITGAISADAALNATATITASGTAADLAAAAVTAAATITASGTETDLAAASVTTTAAITAALSVTHSLAAAPTATAAITAAGTATELAAAAISATATITAAAATGSVANLNTAATITAAATVTGAASAAPAATATITSAGQLAPARAAATASVTAALTAAATASTSAAAVVTTAVTITATAAVPAAVVKATSSPTVSAAVVSLASATGPPHGALVAAQTTSAASASDPQDGTSSVTAPVTSTSAVTGG